MATEAQGEGLTFHPMDQFKIQPLFGEGPIHWYTPTNATLWMGIALLAIFALFVLGTRGRALEDGAPVVKINGHYIPVKAEIVRDTEFSVHGDASDLIDWLRALGKQPDVVFLTHGEPHASAALRKRIADDLGWVAVVPRHGEVVSLT